MVAPALLFGGMMGIMGGASSASARTRAAEEAARMAQFRPLALGGGGGQVHYLGNAGSRVSPDALNQLFMNQFGSRALNNMTGGAFGQGAIHFGSNLGGAMPGFFNQAISASDPTSAVLAGNQFSDFSNQNALAGQAMGLNQMGLANLFGQSQTGINEGIAQQAFGLAGNAFGNQDFSQLAAEQLARSRAAARPGEDRAVNSKFQNLFNRGALASTGGHRQIGELALSQELADIQREENAFQTGNQLAQQNRAFGSQMMNMGLGARGMDQQFNLGAANLFGNLGAGNLQFGQNAAMQGFNTQLGLNELMNTRGQQRLANAQQLMGFGNTLANSNLDRTLGMFGATRGINADLHRLLALSIQGGDARAQAGARAGGFHMGTGISPFGTALGGLGQGIISQFGG